MEEITPERPLVTFALFAYNQEKYIREAIEGAFSQTYEPLEIILSDDCSADRTFEIMQEMAAGYEGPHEVRARKNKVNLGTIDHVLSVSDEARGELLVVAAGDDISLPLRSEILMKKWRDTGAIALYSDCLIIDDCGGVIEHHFAHSPSKTTQRLFRNVEGVQRHNGLVRNIPGYSAAYAVGFLRNLPKNGEKSLNEDALTTIAANVMGGRIEHVRERLLCYRFANTSASHHAVENSINSIIASEKKAAQFSKSSACFYPYVRRVIREIKGSVGSEDLERLDCRLKEREEAAKLQSEIWDKSFLGRVKLFFLAIRADCVKMVLLRLFGVYFFAAAKKLRLLLNK